MATINFADIFKTSDLGTFGTPLTAADIIFSILFSLFTGLFIFYIYKKTYSGVLYSKNFNVTLVLGSMVGSVIMMAIGGNLALSLGMVGALSIIRFRTPVKDPKDLAFLFWAITVGVVNGIRFYKLSIISTLMIGIVMLVLSKKLIIPKPYVIILKHSNASLKEIESVLRRNCSNFELRSTSMSDSELTEQTIEAKIKEKHEDQLLEELKSIKSVKKVMIFSHTGELSE